MFFVIHHLCSLTSIPKVQSFYTPNFIFFKKWNDLVSDVAKFYYTKIKSISIFIDSTAMKKLN